MKHATGNFFLCSSVCVIVCLFDKHCQCVRFDGHTQTVSEYQLGGAEKLVLYTMLVLR